MASVDVVVPTFNGWELTKSCLEHLQRQSLSHRVIVVDNASSDRTPARIRESFPGATLIETGANLGFAAACNRGVAAGDGEIVVLLNNDVDARPDFLERLVEPFEENARLGSVAAVLVRPYEQEIDSVGLTADVTLAGFPRLQGRPPADADADQPVLLGPSGGAAAYRRSAWTEAGGLDEQIFMYMEDLDLALRLSAAGWETTAAPGAVGVHLGSATSGSGSAGTRYHGGFARGYLLRRYGILGTRAAPRALATEAAVALADLILTRDAGALRGRVTGWRTAGGAPRRPRPPRAALDEGISFRESLRLRRASTASRTSP